MRLWTAAAAAARQPAHGCGDTTTSHHGARACARVLLHSTYFIWIDWLGTGGTVGVIFAFYGAITIAKEDSVAGETQEDASPPKQPFVVCVNEILKKKGLTHTLFTRTA